MPACSAPSSVALRNAPHCYRLSAVEFERSDEFCVQIQIWLTVFQSYPVLVGVDAVQLRDHLYDDEIIFGWSGKRQFDYVKLNHKSNMYTQ